MTKTELRCAREEAAERLAEIGVADSEEIDWWLAWADRRRATVCDRLAAGLRELWQLAEFQENVATTNEDRSSAYNARAVGRAIRAIARRTRVSLRVDADAQPGRRAPHGQPPEGGRNEADRGNRKPRQ